MPLFSIFPAFKTYLDSLTTLLFGSETTHADVALCNDDVPLGDDDEYFSDAQQDPDTGPPHPFDTGDVPSESVGREMTPRSDLFAVALSPALVDELADQNVTIIEDKRLILFKNRHDAIDFCKQHKLASPRWKRVADTKEAEYFLSNALSNAFSLPDANENSMQLKSINRESVTWRMPPSQETVKLRKAIESGSMDDVRGIIDSNPRFLIGSGDTPTVLQEGCRYNACHIAAKAGRVEMLSLVLETLRTEAFMKKMYPNDTDDTTRSRMAFLIDLYLNTPDKTRRSETPLHFACKFGSIDCVRLLLDQPECDRSVRNGDGLMANEIICERVSGQTALARRIESLFEERFVIPIVRDDDSDCLPRIGEPVTPKQLDSLLKAAERTPRSNQKLSAVVGPVTSPVAFEVMAELKTARRGPLERQMRRTDAEKGLETIARKVARRHGVRWTEWWQFLDCHVDISSSEGLEAFENYLKGRYTRDADVKFIIDDRPTKTDFHVWTALQPIVNGIDKVQLPFIGRWTSNMSLYTDDEMKLWTTPIKGAKKFSEKGAGDSIDCIVNLMSRFSAAEGR